MSSNSFTEAQIAFMSSNSFTPAQIAAMSTLFGNPSSALSETPIGDELSHGQQCFDTDEVFFTPEQEAEVLDLMDQEEDEALLAHMGVDATEPLAEEALPKKRGAPKGPRTAPAPECRCMARVYGTGHDQCKSRRHPEHGDYCGTHGKMAKETEEPLQFYEVSTELAAKMSTSKLQKGLFHGRIDQPRPTHNAEGERCVFWSNEDPAMLPTEANPATFRGEVGGGWHIHSAQGKKAATLLKRWNAKKVKADKVAAKEAEKLLKASAKKTEMAKKEATKVAEKAQKSAAKKAEKAQKANAKKLLKKTLPKKPKPPSAFFNWLNAPGTRDVITSHLAKMPARTTVVRQSEVTSMAGQMWKHLDDDAKAQWKTAPTTEAQAAE